MGHSKEINESVYQCPLGILEIAVVGGYLDILDAGKIFLNLFQVIISKLWQKLNKWIFE